MGSLTDVTSAERDAFYPAQLAAALWLVETRIRLLSGLIQVSCIKKFTSNALCGYQLKEEKEE